MRGRPDLMRHQIQADSSIPQNSWGIAVRDGQCAAVIGTRVEAHDDFIAEGAWVGDFSALGLIASPFRCASGVIFRDGEVIVCAPMHGMEPVYAYLRSDGTFAASNSVAFLCVVAELNFNKDELHRIRKAAHTLTQGLTYCRELHRDVNGALLRVAWSELCYSTGQVTETPIRRGEAPFATFTEYRAHLITTLSSLWDNARDPRRTKPYLNLVSTCSGGYDSAACSALAKAIGGETVVTLSTGRGGPIDSGAGVAHALGMTCLEFPREETALEALDGERYLISPEISERSKYAEFIGSINSVQDSPYLAFSEAIRNAVLLTGFHGDKVWVRSCKSGPQVKRGDSSGSGMDEFRKRISFVHVPVAFIRVLDHEQISNIAMSDEMAPYTVEGSYNRPIPRRIVEEAGVPRHLFGNKKAAAAALLQPSSIARFQAFQEMMRRYRSAALRLA